MTLLLKDFISVPRTVPIRQRLAQWIPEHDFDAGVSVEPDFMETKSRIEGVPDMDLVLSTPNFLTG